MFNEFPHRRPTQVFPRSNMFFLLLLKEFIAALSMPNRSYSGGVQKFKQENITKIFSMP
jgi:hypothetical protein